MPELPEVETIRRDLEKEVVGKKLKEVSVTGSRTVRRRPEDFKERLEGRKVLGVDRRGKYLVVRLDGPDVLVIHLRMSGQLLKATAKDPLDKHTHAVLTFAPPHPLQVRFVDPRTFGELFVTPAEAIESEVPELAHLGFDPLDTPMSWERFGLLVRGRKAKLKTLLMDQTFIAGIGNLYADEILFAAGLRYDRDSASISPQEARRLWRGMTEVLAEAIKARGSSLADEQYVDLFGRIGKFQEQHQVYAREGKRCLRCRGTIARVKFAQRSTYFCPACQV
ncbi:MAG: bifunctional DNA-formamidopyrimidine glycosylase/DNA-(apurinic or apyrimidinic site) lyase [Acidimicrobiales bacterium]